MENWKDIERFDLPYQVSNLGRVRRLECLNARGRKLEERILSGSANSHGYIQVCLMQNGKGRLVSVHALVAEAFLGYSRDGKMTTVVNHIDEDKTNNNVLNLEVTSQRQNNIHSKTKRRKNGLPANVYISGSKYQVQIRHGDSHKVKDGKGCEIYLGTYSTIAEAVEMRDQYYHELENDKFKDLIIK